MWRAGGPAEPGGAGVTDAPPRRMKMAATTVRQADAPGPLRALAARVGDPQGDDLRVAGRRVLAGRGTMPDNAERLQTLATQLTAVLAPGDAAVAEQKDLFPAKRLW